MSPTTRRSSRVRSPKSTTSRTYAPLLAARPACTGLFTPTRELRSDLLLVKPASEDRWLQFRDVFEVDGKPIRDRDERLHKLFVESTPGSIRQADQIQAEGARYNIGPITRTMNVPILALMFLDQANQSRFTYERARPGNTRAFAAMTPEANVWAIDSARPRRRP